MTDTIEQGTAGTNWAGNYAYKAGEVRTPTSVEELRGIVRDATRIRVLGSRHSFNDIADSEVLVSLAELPADLVIDRDASTATFSAGLPYGKLAELLGEEGLAIHNLASLPHISVGGAIATATHGSGIGNGNLGTAVAALELITADGETVTYRRGDDDFDGVVVGLGALGVVTRVTLDVEPAYLVRQRVFEGLSWDAFDENLEDVFGGAYSVSVFTRFGEATDQVWLKSRVQLDVDGQPEDEVVVADYFGAPAATEERHPILGIDPVNSTSQLGVVGLWSDRLSHFKMGFTPSDGEEIQSEFHVPLDRAVEAVQALRAMGDRIRPILLVCELRAVAEDRLWLSPQFGQTTIGLHFTWKRDQEAVEALLVELEAAIRPFGARPHWGKVFTAEAADITPLYPRSGDFLALAERLDPAGKFRNAWFERSLLG
ncbi:D-arabinono-1,4-lactone oxidase [Clavibacter phaseoli]|uniref:D-arabinono-1,4-lactone oxidase n=1 Tax=Clavibacter phaseoli TaxID=1734031 RepID=UPI000E66282F|nr:D-arabinono-1,4-lactone oxidase [Clavibacter phaseoli]RIJ56737.1 FAD-binding protein [Clavibacter phaseoli]UKF30114.1 FAD-binding protein [Clavibacter phaseoli]UKF36032.1 FAD-binding protein [Clavibacter phaseoli]